MHKHPQAIVCLLSALRFHDLTTQAHFEVWLAIPNKARAPKIEYPPIRIVRFSGVALIDGIEDHQIDRVTVEQQVIVEPFHQLSFRAYGIENLQKLRSEQHLWNNLATSKL